MKTHRHARLRRESGPPGAVIRAGQAAVDHRGHAKGGGLPSQGPHLRLAAADPLHHPGKFDRLGLIGPEQGGHPFVDGQAQRAVPLGEGHGVGGLARSRGAGHQMQDSGHCGGRFSR